MRPLIARVREKLQKKQSTRRWASPAPSRATSFSRKKCLVGNIRSGPTQPVRFPATVIIKSPGVSASRFPGVFHPCNLPGFRKWEDQPSCFSQLKRLKGKSRKVVRFVQSHEVEWSNWNQRAALGIPGNLHPPSHTASRMEKSIPALSESKFWVWPCTEFIAHVLGRVYRYGSFHDSRNCLLVGWLVGHVCNSGFKVFALFLGFPRR